MSDTRITELTRRNLFDELRVRNTSWAGRLGESDFLDRIFPLKDLPSHDHRQSNMMGDVWMHREHFVDWPDDWVYDDGRLDLMGCKDELLLSFLCEMIHPVVRSDEKEIADLLDIFNRHLAGDGYELTPSTYISGKPIYAARLRHAGISQAAVARKVADELSSEYVVGLITRMETAIERDPALAIGSAKEFVESICKGILTARKLTLTGSETLPQLVKAVREALDLSVSAKTSDTLKQTLGGLASITHGLAELRGQLGSGHGHHPGTEKPAPYIARLSVNAAIALGVFLYDTHREARVAGVRR
jgi:hypothetical protein